jgi:hypothetical protein
MLAAGRRSPASPVAEQWIGISFDGASTHEAIQDWQINRWPLIEQQMTRHDCLRWLERHGSVPPDASPFHSDDHWRDMRDPTPMHSADAVWVDQAIRTAGIAPFMAFAGDRSVRRSRSDDDAADRGQLDLWPNEQGVRAPRAGAVPAVGAS